MKKQEVVEMLVTMRSQAQVKRGFNRDVGYVQVEGQADEVLEDYGVWVYCIRVLERLSSGECGPWPKAAAEYLSYTWNNQALDRRNSFHDAIRRGTITAQLSMSRALT